MKNLLLGMVLMLGISQLAAQKPERTFAKNEIKLNTLYLPGGHVELSYERIMKKHSAIGLTLGSNFIKQTDFPVDELLPYDFSIVPYYRIYFNRKPATGFFLEANSNINFAESYSGYKETNLGIGMALGGKFNFGQGWGMEFYAGLGYNTEEIFKNDANESETVFVDLDFPDIYPRLGVSVGKRF